MTVYAKAQTSILHRVNWSTSAKNDIRTSITHYEPLTVVAFPSNLHRVSCSHWVLWAKERRWEAPELMHKRSQHESKGVITAIGGLYSELAEELRRDPAARFCGDNGGGRTGD